ncbi:hypothetical protein CRM22_002779 [Opisthorchis felineus]|uniref:Uncharacterized protein n=1 Tax=Opisthorchis felineus TaxID=147828 RepID=A0A4S2M8X3_OPIFE|nr:hypothetical protein CRM22_002779 [Opisthorchis felineus]
MRTSNIGFVMLLGMINFHGGLTAVYDVCQFGCNEMIDYSDISENEIISNPSEIPEPMRTAIYICKSSCTFEEYLRCTESCRKVYASSEHKLTMCLPQCSSYAVIRCQDDCEFGATPCSGRHFIH